MYFYGYGVSDYYHNYVNNILPSWNTSDVGRKKLLKIAEKIRIQSIRKNFDCIIGMTLILYL